MKKEIKIIIFYGLSFINMIFLYGGRFIGLPYILSNIALFTLIVFIAYLIIDWFTNKLLNKKLTESKQNIIIFSRVAVFFLVIILIGGSQLIYIQKKDTLYQRRCEYYDQYNNIIYESFYTGVCPDLAIITQNNDQLIFEVNQDAIGSKNFEAITSRGIVLNNVDGDVTLTSLSNITIEYNDNHDITLFDIKLSEYITYTKSGENKAVFYSYHREVKNTIGSSFESIVKEAEYIAYSAEFIDSLSHFEFNDLDYSKYRLYESGIDNIDDPIGDSTIIKEQFISETETISEIVLQISHSSTQVSVDAYYDMNWDTPAFTESSLYSYDGYMRIAERV
ncbi:MAG: hypothetical protein QM489_03415, partial [Candidatus Izemoplasma sp.]